MKSFPTISIIIPVFNEADHVKRCLTSIKNQTMQPLEVLVIDNNCTDNSVYVAKQFAGVRILKEPVQGIVFARNTGFNAAKGQILARIDADTVLPPNWLEKVATFYANEKNTNKALSGGGYFYNFRLPRFNGWLQSQLTYRFNRFVIGHYILWGSNMAIPQAMWRRVRATTCTNDDYHEDMDLAIHCVKAGYAITYDASLQAGVQLKRVWEDRWHQRAHLARWPRTLKEHGYKLWWMGSIGNIFLPLVGEPFFFVSEGVARLLRRPRLPK